MDLSQATATHRVIGHLADGIALPALVADGGPVVYLSMRPHALHAVGVRDDLAQLEALGQFLWPLWLERRAVVVGVILNPLQTTCLVAWP